MNNPVGKASIVNPFGALPKMLLGSVTWLMVLLMILLMAAWPTQAAQALDLLPSDVARNREIIAAADTPEEALNLLTGDPARDAEIVENQLLRDAGTEPAVVPEGAQILRVGGDNACDYSRVQDAINDARSLPATDVIRIARNAEYTSQALQINDKSMILEGGYASCAASQPDPSNTILDGTGGSNRPVIRIRNEDNSQVMRVELRRLTIQGGTTSTSRILRSASLLNGAGLNIRGRVQADLTNTLVRNNATSSRRASFPANNGGGIYIDGEGSPGSFVRLNEGSFVLNNVTNNGRVRTAAHGSGGGIYCQAGTVILSARSGVHRNRTRGERPGNGGGVSLSSACTLNSQASVINSNESGASGGGISAEGSTVFLLDTRILGNRARGVGGGISSINSELLMRRLDTPCAGLPIHLCSRLENNHADGNGGALHLSTRAEAGRAELRQTTIAGNSSGRLGSVALVSGSGTELLMEGVAVHGNHGSSRLFQLQDQSLTSLDWSTIAGNQNSNDPPLQVFRLLNVDRSPQNTRLRVRGSIVWEPGATIANRTGRTFTPSNCTIGHARLEDSGLSVGSQFYSRIDPRLRNLEDADLRLQPNSPAIDYCDDGEVGLTPRFDDLFGNARGVRHNQSTITPPNPGSGDFDLGVHEVT
ncbi:hypothetical protein GS597_06495 [Synechococcales cyanobacterium C]|uniref:Uncharacterized protein n=1 Tax=Petrachloros mirabilis ULC683 TaxID=2781853 RepID=A0A8K2A6T3_9CYAN|nr:hypothetical protein [Petrachloros mirabilis]NCJ06171.1 hypothetical protein [Petrachloros mirabilis ULC683]